MVRLLIDGGAKPHEKDITGQTPFYGAVACIQYNHDTDLVKLLLDKGADPNETDGQGTTPLHWAAQFGRPDLVKLLMKRGAEPDMKDAKGQTPLHRASKYPVGRPLAPKVLFTFF